MHAIKKCQKNHIYLFQLDQISFQRNKIALQSLTKTDDADSDVSSDEGFKGDESDYCLILVFKISYRQKSSKLNGELMMAFVKFGSLEQKKSQK
ncbi:hypothetical protein BpHYR1_031606 [Brachionus plicatilis]|uniref:Uncharacterized protein n=1 Tax=Brachionus plicatilis TaxID=10195 RepID=A0A3M7Q7Z0_BRAPC|nr:hypothetical protein BpHYR1_031606 [Brachionus plicatilis]